MNYAMLSGTGSYCLALTLFVVVCALIIFGIVDCYIERKRIDKMLDERYATNAKMTK